MTPERTRAVGRRVPPEASRVGSEPDARAVAREPLLLRDREAAALCGISTAHLWRCWAAGRFPRGVLIGRCRRWSTQELREWIEAGCPASPGDLRRVLPNGRG